MQPVEPDVERHLDPAQDRGSDVVEGDLEAGDDDGAHAATLRRSIVDGPVPRQEFVEPVDGVIGDASKHVGEPGLRIDVVEFRRHDQRRHERGAIGAAFGAGEEP